MAGVGRAETVNGSGQLPTTRHKPARCRSFDTAKPSHAENTAFPPMTKWKGECPAVG